MAKTSKAVSARVASARVVSAEAIAERATQGENIAHHFTGKFEVVRPVKRVNLDLTPGMLRELDARAVKLNVSRQAVIKTLLRTALDAR